MRTQLTIILISLFTVLPMLAQNGKESFEEYQRRKQAEMNNYLNRKHQQIDDYLARKHKEFEDYRRKKNLEFAEHLAQPWQKRNMMPAEPLPMSPDPVKPTVAPEPDTKVPERPQEMPQPIVKPIDIPQPVKPLDIPLPEPEGKPAEQTRPVDLFGMRFDISMTDNLRFKLKTTKEKEMRDMWKRLSADDYTPLFEDCARICQDRRFNGWATLNLCRLVSEKLLGENTNEAALLQTYLLTQLGYDARMALADGQKLLTMFSANTDLCGIVFIVIDGKRYYINEDLPDGTGITTYSDNFDAAIRPIDFTGGTSILFDAAFTQPRRFTSKWNEDASVEVGVNKCLIRYYEHMPAMSDLSVYARERMEGRVENAILPTLRDVVSGKDEVAAANELLHFVQTAFAYETDERQFGKEKTFFKEESFYYRACDCEDRSVLYADLVERLLGLDVVLLHFPNHLCTAVRFNGDAKGDFVTISGHKYVICDPTYINASVGTCMPQFAQVKAEVYMINQQ